MANFVVDDEARIQNMIKNIDFCSENIKNVTEDEFTNNLKLQYALCMSLQIICENSNHITDETKNKAKEIEWSALKTTRNIISHEYGALNILSVYDTIKDDLPILKEKLNDLSTTIKYDNLLKNFKFYVHNNQNELEKLDGELKNKTLDEKVKILKNKVAQFEYIQSNLDKSIKNIPKP